jgi:hypothetical protein
MMFPSIVLTLYELPLYMMFPSIVIIFYWDYAIWTYLSTRIFFDKSASREYSKAQFQKLRKATISFVIVVFSSVLLSTWNNMALTGGIFMKFYIWVFFKYMSRYFKLHYNLRRQFCDKKFLLLKKVQISTHLCLLPLITVLFHCAIRQFRLRNNKCNDL